MSNGLAISDCKTRHLPNGLINLCANNEEHQLDNLRFTLHQELKET